MPLALSEPQREFAALVQKIDEAFAAKKAKTAPVEQAKTVLTSHADLNEKVAQQVFSEANKRALYGEFPQSLPYYFIARGVYQYAGIECGDRLAVTHSKIAIAFWNLRNNDAAAWHFETALDAWKSHATPDAEAFGECLMYYGKMLQEQKKFERAVDVLELAYQKYTAQASSADRDQRVALARQNLLATAERPKNADKREQLRSRVNRILGLRDIVEPPSLKKGLELLHKEGLAKSLDLKKAQSLVRSPKKSSGADDDDRDGSWDLLEALRKHYEAGNDSEDAFISCAEAFDEDDEVAVFDRIMRHAGKFIRPEWHEEAQSLSRRCGSVTEFARHINDLMEKSKASSRFHALDASEDEAVLWLLNDDVFDRFARKELLPFMDV